MSRIRMLAASMISNPLFAPFLVWFELQVGHRIMAGAWYPLKPSELDLSSIWTLGIELAVGTVAVAGILGLLGGLVVWWWIPRGVEANERRRRVELAAEPFLDVGILEWWRTRRELSGNLQLAQRVSAGEFGAGGRLVDLGCGNGGLMSLVLEVEPDLRPRRLTGVTLTAEGAANGRKALGDRVSIEVADPATWPIPSADGIFVWYTSRRNAPVVDERLARKMFEALSPEGTAVIAGSGGRFPVAAGHTVDDLENLFESIGFTVEQVPRLPHDLHRSRLIVAKRTSGRPQD